MISKMTAVATMMTPPAMDAAKRILSCGVNKSSGTTGPLILRMSLRITECWRRKLSELFSPYPLVVNRASPY